MLEVKLYLAKVVNNNDSAFPDKKKLGRVQVRLIPEMETIQDVDLPWAKPFMLPVANSYMIPEIGDVLYVISLDEFYKTLFYLDVAAFDATRNQQVAYQQAAKFATGQYPNLKVEQYKDGTCIFRDSTTGDIGVVHKSGTILAIGGDGKVYLQNDSGSLKEGLLNLINVLTNAINGANWIGNTGSPLIYKKMGTDGATLNDTTTIINSLLGEK